MQDLSEGLTNSCNPFFITIGQQLDTERFYKYVLPTTDNTCIVPAPESQVIKKAARYTVTVAVNDEAMGTATGGGTEFLYDDEVTVTAVANTNYEFVNWTENGTEVSANSRVYGRTGWQAGYQKSDVGGLCFGGEITNNSTID